MAMAENKEKKVLNVPNLRFPEFEGEWQENYVNEICNEFKRRSNYEAFFC